jgi:hypothetical protein
MRPNTRASLNFKRCGSRGRIRPHSRDTAPAAIAACRASGPTPLLGHSRSPPITGQRLLRRPGQSTRGGRVHRSGRGVSSGLRPGSYEGAWRRPSPLFQSAIAKTVPLVQERRFAGPVSRRGGPRPERHLPRTMRPVRRRRPTPTIRWNCPCLPAFLSRDRLRSAAGSVRIAVDRPGVFQRAGPFVGRPW